MYVLKYGSTGSAVELLQLVLNRAGYGELQIDGIFGEQTAQALRRYQSANGLLPDAVLGSQTRRSLLPWYLGYVSYTVQRGDSLYSIAQRFGSSVEALETANPNVRPMNLQIGETLVVPLPFPVVPTNISCSSQLVSCCVRGLATRYPFIATGEIGRSVMGKPLWSMKLGSGENRVLYNAGFHANEWICTGVVLKFAEDLCAAYVRGERIFSVSAAELWDYASIYLVPAVNPDGIDLVTGALSSGDYYAHARGIGANYPQFSFPEGWKANIQGVDLNLQYPALWEQAREIKLSQGIVSPAPADYVGAAPLTAPEARSMYDYTLAVDPSLILAYHTQGQVIYWRFQDYEPENSRDIAATFSAVSGYQAEETPYASGFAGYKDWFIQSFNRPGYTIEAGTGLNPLPIEQFDGIYRRNLGILTLGALVT